MGSVPVLSRCIISLMDLSIASSKMLPVGIAKQLLVLGVKRHRQTTFYTREPNAY